MCSYRPKPGFTHHRHKPFNQSATDIGTRRKQPLLQQTSNFVCWNFRGPNERHSIFIVMDIQTINKLNALWYRERTQPSAKLFINLCLTRTVYELLRLKTCVINVHRIQLKALSMSRVIGTKVPLLAGCRRWQVPPHSSPSLKWKSDCSRFPNIAQVPSVRQEILNR